MGISIKRWILSKLGLGGTSEISSLELQQALEEYRIRELAFHTCVAMIANAVGKCTFKTYRKHEENRGEEYYLWNVEPNPNQNSTAFLHKLIYQLYKENEVLIISGGKRADGNIWRWRTALQGPQSIHGRKTNIRAWLSASLAIKRHFRKAKRCICGSTIRILSLFWMGCISHT